MKKVILSIISLLSAICLTFGVSGCNGKNSQPEDNNPPTIQKPTENETNNKKSDNKDFITETAPYYDRYVSQYRLYDSNGWEYGDSYYYSFKDYLDNEFRQNCKESFYIWTPNAELAHDYEYNSEGYRYDFRFKAFNIFAFEDKEKNTFYCPKYELDFLVLPQEWNDDHSATEYWKDIYASLNIFSEAVEPCEGELTVRFGEVEIIKNYSTKGFANINCGETCVATCYFSLEGPELTIEWLAEYLKTHLTLWGANNA